ncbi:unnamed protein product [Caenorhabditis auriculariae]|uniref:UNC93-like protein MFSD11 n=1 Tax=Caenorhabditis auriculariae TaxID=2777116 RepID=A0A8S1H760_9PELO|nr:unnamed protein product [Caenorhabditis auriculariae]
MQARRTLRRETALTFTLLGDLVEKIGRNIILIIGTAIHLFCFAFIYFLLPADAPLGSTSSSDTFITPSVVFVVGIGFLLGVVHVVWFQQITALICNAYPHQETEAFALSRFMQAAMTCGVISYASLVTLPYQMTIAAVFSVAACFSYILSAKNQRQKVGQTSIFSH